jgi:hypothetical protein
MPKTISDPITCSVQTMHLSCIEINTISKRTKTSYPFDPRYLGVPSGAPKMILMPVVHLLQTMHLSNVEVNIIYQRTEATSHLNHVT